jgi:hypothetical protein
MWRAQKMMIPTEAWKTIELIGLMTNKSTKNV